MAEFEHDGSALAAVRAFLAQHDDSSPEEEDPPEKYIPRPTRLGVGANPNHAVHGGSTHALGEANRRLGSALRRQARAAESSDEGNVESSDDDDVESRARAIGKRFKTQHKMEARQAVEKQTRSRGQNQESEQAVESKEKAHSESDDEWGDDILRRMTEEQDADFTRWSKGFVPVADVDCNSNENASERHEAKKGHNAEVMLRRKKKKKRSRQKNLKRDKRNRHELPAHLTDETLKAGRVRKSESGKPQFHASHAGVSSRKARSLHGTGTVARQLSSR